MLTLVQTYTFHIARFLMGMAEVRAMNQRGKNINNHRVLDHKWVERCNMVSNQSQDDGVTCQTSHQYNVQGVGRVLHCNENERR
jgi:hypothetical protein